MGVVKYLASSATARWHICTHRDIQYAKIFVFLNSDGDLYLFSQGKKHTLAVISYADNISRGTQSPTTRDTELPWETCLKANGPGGGREQEERRRMRSGRFACSWNKAEWGNDFPRGCSVRTKVAWAGCGSLGSQLWGTWWQSVDLIGICVALWRVVALVITIAAGSEELVDTV